MNSWGRKICFQCQDQIDECRRNLENIRQSVNDDEAETNTMKMILDTYGKAWGH